MISFGVFRNFTNSCETVVYFAFNYTATIHYAIYRYTVLYIDYLTDNITFCNSKCALQ